MDKMRRAFVGRLNEVCNDKQLPADRGRQTRLAETFKVSPQAARKWLKGEAYPALETMMQIAVWAEVSFEWLSTGRGEKKMPIEATEPSIKHVAAKMLAMEPEQRYLVTRLVDTVANQHEDNDAPDDL